MLLIAGSVCYCFVVGVKRFLGVEDPEMYVQLEGQISHYPTYSGGAVYGHRATSAGVVSMPASYRSSSRSQGSYTPAYTATSSRTMSSAGGATMHVYTTSSATMKSIGGGGGGSAAVGTSVGATSAPATYSTAGTGVATLAMVSSASRRSSLSARQSAAMAYEAALSGSNDYGEVDTPVRRAIGPRKSGGAGVGDCGCEAGCGCLIEVENPETGEPDYICTHGGCGQQDTCGCPVGGPILPMLLMAVGYIAYVEIRKKFTPRQEE